VARLGFTKDSALIGAILSTGEVLTLCIDGGIDTCVAGLDS